MKRILTLSFALIAFSLSAQLSDGSIAPDFSLDDLDGQTHDLYDYLDDGYSVILDFSATWCGPCWSYHQTGNLEEIWGDYGPGGEDNVMVFMIEADPATSFNCIYGPSGCTGGSIGDWTTGVDYPILNPDASEAATVNSDFQINYFPTLYGVAPNGEIYEIGQASVDEWVTWTAHSFQMHNTTWEVNDEDCTTSFIDLQTVGGEGDILFEWSNGSTDEDLFNVEAGSYMVTMTDENDYEVVKGPIIVESNNTIIVDLVEVVNILCSGEENGYLEVEADGGSGDYDVEWSNGSSELILENVPGGGYDLLITDNDSGCEFEFEFEIEEPDELDLEYEVENPDCGDNELGSVEFNIDGGTYPYLYTFEDFETSDEFITLEEGEYQPTITDFNGCVIYVPLFEIVPTDAPMAMSQAIGQFTCAMDSVVVSAENSTTGPNISYAWYDQSNTLVGTTSVVQVDSAGMYTLEVINNTNDCSTTSQVMVMEDYSTPTAIANSMGDIDCNNSFTMLTSTGSTSDSSAVYTWTTTDGNILTDANAASIDVGSAGTYMLRVDNIYSGCFQTASVDVTESDVPQLEVVGTNEFCFGSSTTLCVTENGGETASWYVDGNMVSNNFCFEVQESANIEIFLTNNVTGCQSQDAIQTVAHEAPTVALDGDLQFCEGTSSTLCLDNPEGHGVAWFVDGTSTASTNCIEVTTTSNIEVMMTNNSTGCQASQSFASTLNANPTLMIPTPSMLDCNNSESVLSLNTNATEIVWYDALDVVIGTSASISVSEAGQYTAVVMTATGCSTSQSVMVEANLDELPFANYEYVASDYTFTFTDMSQGTIIGRTWDFGDGNTSIEANPVHTYDAPGFYKVNLITNNDCGSSTFEEEVLATTALQLTTATTSISCFGDSNASIQLGIGGGLPGYTYEWTAPNGDVFNEQNLQDLPAGTYHILITDAAGYIIEDDVTISEPEELLVDATIVNSVSTASEGSIELNISGGSAPYSVLWSNGASDVVLSGLSQGEYTAVITDSKGCTDEQVYTVTGTTNVDELDFVNEFKVSPNPAVSFLDINVELNQIQPLQISLISLDGKVIQRVNNNTKLINHRIELSDVANGIYLVELRSTNKVSIKKVIVAK